MDSELCPLCSGPLVMCQQVDVCHDCHKNLELSGATPLSVTGEFSAVAGGSQASAFLSSVSVPPPVAPNPNACCWCSKRPEDVRKMLSQGGYHICNECVALCADVLQMELGDDYGTS